MPGEKRKRGRPPIAFDFSNYSIKRSFREHDARLKQHQRDAGILKAGRPKGLLVDKNYGTRTGNKIVKQPLIIPAGRLALGVEVRIENAREAGKYLSLKAATLETLRSVLLRFDRVQLAEYLLDTTMRLLRDYRKKRPWEYPKCNRE